MRGQARCGCICPGAARPVTASTRAPSCGTGRTAAGIARRQRGRIRLDVGEERGVGGAVPGEVGADPFDRVLQPPVLQLVGQPVEPGRIEARPQCRPVRCQAVRLLPIAYRQPVILTLEDFSPAEIATMLGLSQNVIGVRLNRARSMLREMLKPGEP